MKRDRFDEPHILINRVYTKRGDGGETRLVGGHLVSKDSLRVQANGTVDELNAFVGLALQTLLEKRSDAPALEALITILTRIQHELFNLGSVLATKKEEIQPRQPCVTVEDIARLEGEIDRLNEPLAPLKSFVLAGGSRPGVELHVCRTVCRRAERLCVQLSKEEGLPDGTIAYLNRLSDAFFVWSRWTNHVLGAAETLWNPNS
jgi:cob(I)alamin adenosyltransferase